jgi:hypothetical protein
MWTRARDAMVRSTRLGRDAPKGSRPKGDRTLVDMAWECDRSWNETQQTSCTILNKTEKIQFLAKGTTCNP